MGLKSILFHRLPIAFRVRIFKLMLMDRPCGYGEPFRVTLNKSFDTFLKPEERENRKLLRKLTDDMIKCWLEYLALPYEYFLFNFRNRSDKERMEFETDIDRIQTLLRVTGKKVFLDEINNKYNFYTLAKPFFHREVIRIDKNTSPDEFVNFCARVKEVFIKPLESSQGRGAQVFTYSTNKDAIEFFNQLNTDKVSWMVEERIKQSNSMGQWNETSVNTIRIPSFLRDGKLTIMWTRMRVGKKGAIVDNAGAGGIVVNVDPQSGIITSDGIDESHNRFQKHPDSNLVFKGWKVPRWEELLKIVEDLHRSIFNRHVYIAWDFALTDDGWVVVEGNWGQLLGQQTASQIGVRKEFHKLIGDYGK